MRCPGLAPVSQAATQLLEWMFVGPFADDHFTARDVMRDKVYFLPETMPVEYLVRARAPPSSPKSHLVSDERMRHTARSTSAATLAGYATA